MKKNSLFFLLLLLIQIIPGSSVSARDPIRFGLHQNPPLNFTDGDGRVRGFAIDMLEYVAAQEGWQIEYIPGDAAQSLKRLEVGEIDLFGAIAYSEKRTEHYDFTNETLITNWGQIYIHPGEDISSILDLEGKKIAGTKNGIHTIALHKMLKGFKINSIFVEAPDFPTTFNLLDRGEADAGVVNRLFAIQNESKYNVKRLPIIFNPIEIRFAVTKNKHHDLLTALDSHMEKQKADQGSVYYQSLNQWFNIVSKPAFPDWVRWALGSTVGLITLFIGISILLKIQVKNRTKELEEEIVERKQAEEALGESEEKHRTLFETMIQGAVYQDAEGNIFSANRSAEKLLGLSLDQMQGRTSIDPRWKSIHEDGSDFPGEKHPSMVALNTGRRIENVIMGVFNPEEEWHRWININAVPQFREGETKPYQVYTTFHDITERKQAEESLRESEEQYRLLAEISPHAIVLHSDGIIKYVNPAGVEMFRVSGPEELIGTSHFDRIHPDDLAESKKRAKKVLEEGWTAPPRQHRVITPDNHVIEVESTGTSFRSKGTTMVQTIFQDITERKKLEAQLQQAQKMESIGTLAGGIAHDFNNILSPIMIHSEMAMMDLPPDSSLQFNLKQIFQSGERARDLVKQILTFSRQKQQDRTPLKMSIILKEALKLLRSSLPTTIEIHESIKSESDSVLADLTQIHQIVMNLCTNAAHAMREKGGILEVSLTDEYLDSRDLNPFHDISAGSYLRLTVKDTGHGIDSEVINKIFDPYSERVNENETHMSIN